MPDNLPQDFKDVEDATVILTDSRGHNLTHYVLAERLLQVEYATVRDEILSSESSETLTYILEGGFRGFHKYSGGELFSEWQELEHKFYDLYDADRLPWELYDEDPLLEPERA